MRKYILILIISLTLTNISCYREDNSTNFSLDRVSGYVQKGPYLNGTAITISELSDELRPTGRTFSTQIIDNKGTFEIKDVGLSSEFVELTANGFYYNEIVDASSDAQLTMYAITNLLDSSRININVLSTLEKSRVNFLIENGIKLNEAKQQAQSEILKIFEISNSDIENSEYLDISHQSEGNAILLAISVILQGYLSVGELSELIANISTDLRQDGVLNSNILGETLINNASVLNSNIIRKNLEDRYDALGMETVIPEFERYLNQFIDSTKFIVTNRIEYPTKYDSKKNILVDSAIIVESGITYSMAVYLPKGTTITIICKPSVGFDWGPSGFFVTEAIGYQVENNYPEKITLKAFGNDQAANIPVMFGESGPISPTSIDFIIYENESDTATRIKTVRSFEIK